MEQEMGEPVVKRFAYILHKTGILPFPKVNGIPVKFRYKSPLSLSKGRADAERFIQYVQILQGIMGPDVTQLYINPKTTPYLLGEMLQVDERFLNKPKAVAQIMQQVQNKQSMAELANPAGMMPEQPQNPSQQTILQ
jgi:hypothetical protein